MPAAEMHETPEAIELRVEVPGMEAKELNVQVRQKPFLSLASARLRQNSRKGMTRSGGGMSQQISDSDSVTGAFSGASAQQQTILRDVQTAYWLPLWENSLTSFCQRFALVD